MNERAEPKATCLPV